MEIEVRHLYSNHQFFKDSERKLHARKCKHRPTASVCVSSSDVCEARNIETVEVDEIDHSTNRV